MDTAVSTGQEVMDAMIKTGQEKIEVYQEEIMASLEEMKAS
jgi:hypothetical protein